MMQEEKRKEEAEKKREEKGDKAKEKKRGVVFEGGGEIEEVPKSGAARESPESSESAE